MTEFIAGTLVASAILLTGIFAGLKIERERTMSAIRKHLEREGKE